MELTGVQVEVSSTSIASEIIGREGKKIRHIKEITNTNITSPLRGGPPIFYINGLPHDVEEARKLILASAAHFDKLRSYGRPQPLQQEKPQQQQNRGFPTESFKSLEMYKHVNTEFANKYPQISQLWD